jgi:SAM-dependent methyltransferase
VGGLTIPSTSATDPDPATAAALARLYDLDLAEDPGDLDLYLALAERTGGPILELAVGTGRLAVPLAEAGYDVTGVDIDPAMLDRARSRAAASDGKDRLSFVEADLVGVKLSDAGRYRLGFIALNSLMLLASRDAQRSAVRTLADHLAPGGLAVVDVWLPDADDLARFDGRIVLEWPRRDPESGALVTKAASALHDSANASVTLTTLFEEGRQGEAPRRWVREDRLRLVTAGELRGYAEDAGLSIELLAGGYDLGLLGPGSDRAILIAAR